MMAKDKAPIIERTLKIIPMVQAQLLPCRNPSPTASQMRLKTRTIPPRTRPNPVSEAAFAPKRVDVETRADSPIIAIPPRSPSTPINIARTAIMVIPVGLAGLSGCMWDGRQLVAEYSQCY